MSPDRAIFCSTEIPEQWKPAKDGHWIYSSLRETCLEVLPSNPRNAILYSRIQSGAIQSIQDGVSDHNTFLQVFEGRRWGCKMHAKICDQHKNEKRLT
jgi:hypothetical protein